MVPNQALGRSSLVPWTKVARSGGAPNSALVDGALFRWTGVEPCDVTWAGRATLIGLWQGSTARMPSGGPGQEVNRLKWNEYSDGR